MLKVYKFILLFMCILFQNPVFAKELCVSNDTVAIVLDAIINPISYTPTNQDYGKNFSVTTSYGTLVGITACLSGTFNTLPFGIYEGTLIDNSMVITGGEEIGKYCWCKITHPVVSYWGLGDSDGTGSANCIRNCASNCAQYLYREELPFRSNLFNLLHN